MSHPIRAAALTRPQATNPRALTWALFITFAAAALVVLAIRIAMALASPGPAPHVARAEPALPAMAAATPPRTIARTPPSTIRQTPLAAKPASSAARRAAARRAKPRRRVSLDETTSASDLLDDAASAGLTSRAPVQPRPDKTP